MHCHLKGLPDGFHLVGSCTNNINKVKQRVIIFWSWGPFPSRPFIAACMLRFVHSYEGSFKHLYYPQLIWNMEQSHVCIVGFLVKLKPHTWAWSQTYFVHTKFLPYSMSKAVNFRNAPLKDCSSSGSGHPCMPQIGYTYTIHLELILQKFQCFQRFTHSCSTIQIM